MSRSVSYCKVQLVGYAGLDPHLIAMPHGKPFMAKIVLATSEQTRDAAGNYTETTQWHTIKFFRHNAEKLVKSVTKGDRLHIWGDLETSRWEGKDGVKHNDKIVRCQSFKIEKKKVGFDSGDYEVERMSSNETDTPFGD